MRDAPRHITPGRHPLGADQFGHIVERHDIAFQFRAVTAPHRHADQQVFHPTGPRQPHLFLRRLGAFVAQPDQQRAKFGHRLRQRYPGGTAVEFQQPPG